MRKKLFLLPTCVLVLFFASRGFVVASAQQSEVVKECVVYHIHTENTGSCYSPVYHTHVGNEYSKLGCYQGAKSTKSTVCSGILGAGVKQADGSYNHFCSACNRCVNDSSSGSMGTCYAPKTTTVYALSCGKYTYSIDSYKLVCTSGINTELGTISLVKSNWGGAYKLSIIGDIAISYCWQDSSEGSSISVESNGVYSCKVGYLDSGVNRVISLDYTVEDYDNEPPVITEVKRVGKRCQYEQLQVVATDNYSVTECMIEKK